MPSTSQTDWTVERLHALPDDGNRYEIIDGVLYVTPASRFGHQCAVMALYDRLQPFAKSVGMDVMPLLGDVRYSDRTLVQPDLFLFQNSPQHRVSDWSEIHPLYLVVEVLSRRTRKRDRTVKRDLYQAQGIPEYWIVDIDARVFERWRPESTAAEILTRSISWQPLAALTPLHIELDEYFRSVLGD